jgi:hypothetical protein
MTPFAQALLAIEIAVNALHETAARAPGTRPAVQDTLHQIAHLGFDVRPSEERKTGPAGKWRAAAERKKTQQRLFS